MTLTRIRDVSYFNFRRLCNHMLDPGLRKTRKWGGKETRSRGDWLFTVRLSLH